MLASVEGGSQQGADIHETREKNLEEMTLVWAADDQEDREVVGSRPPQRDGHHVHSTPHHSIQNNPPSAEPGRSDIAGIQGGIGDGLVGLGFFRRSPDNDPRFHCGK